jgi:hypothetical protein
LTANVLFYEGCKYSDGHGTATASLIAAAGILNTSALQNLPEVRQGMASFMHASVAASTWGRYATGWRTFEAFQLKAGREFTWPLSRETLQAFVGYCLVDRKLKPTSVKTYLSSLTKLHKLKGFQDYKMEDSTISALLRGAANLAMSGPPQPALNRRVMTMPMLQIIGHQLAESGWLKNTKQTIWTACLVGFFSSARMGELLAPHETGIDPTATLTWSCVQFREDDSVLIHIRLPKVSTQEGDFVDLFPFPDPPYCPVSALKVMYWQQRAAGQGGLDQAVFTFAGGKQLTREGLNSALKTLLGTIFNFEEGSISCHSFRAALPSALAARPSEISSEDIKNWGRWKSEAYQGSPEASAETRIISENYQEPNGDL